MSEATPAITSSRNQQICELADAGHSCPAIARIVDLSKSQVHRILEKRAEIEATLRPYDRTYHDKLLGDRIIGILERADPDAMTTVIGKDGFPKDVPTPAKDLRDLAIAQAAMTDKLLLLRGQPTEIHGHLHARAEDVVALAEKLVRLVELARGNVHANDPD